MQSQLERNLEKLEATPEGRQALEDALVTWEINTGEHPSDDELESITTIVLQKRSWFLQLFYSSVMILAVFVLGSVFIKALYAMIVGIINADSLW